MSRIIGLLFLLCFAACSTKNSNTGEWPIVNNLAEIDMVDLNGNDIEWNTLQDFEANVFVFISPECPLCENYTKTISLLQEEYGDEKVNWQAIVAGSYYPITQIDSFLNVYQFEIDVLLDKEYKLANYLKATVTPEVFVLNESGMIEYEGKIDNWIYKLGIKRPNITAFYLNDAINAILNGDEILIKETTAVGCIIE